eukprot:1159892-Pelagomonas_calceolata.AAC.25
MGPSQRSQCGLVYVNCLALDNGEVGNQAAEANLDTDLKNIMKIFSGDTRSGDKPSHSPFTFYLECCYDLISPKAAAQQVYLILSAFQQE